MSTLKSAFLVDKNTLVLGDYYEFIQQVAVKLLKYTPSTFTRINWNLNK